MPYPIDLVKENNFLANRSFGFGRRGGILPNPFFDQASMMMPTNIKELFSYCRWGLNVNSLVGATVNKLAVYPLTEIQILPPEDDEGVDDGTMSERIAAWDKLLNKDLKIKNTLINIGLDYYTYGSSFIAPVFIKENVYTCEVCGSSFDMLSKSNILRGSVDQQSESAFFSGYCSQCMMEQNFKVEEIKPDNARLYFNILTPEDIDIEYNSTIGARTYFYNVPALEKSMIMAGNPEMLKNTDKNVLLAAIANRPLKIRPGKLYHFMSVGSSGPNKAWPLPPMLRVLRDVYQMQVLRRSQEAIAAEHITPIRFVFPNPSAGIMPTEMMNLQRWKDETMEGMFMGKQDPNITIFSKLPVGVSNLGGDARGLFITPEMEYLKMIIINGFMCPREFIEGGLTYSGSSMSLRMLETQFGVYRDMLEEFINWTKQIIMEHTGLGNVTIKFKRLKMADDVQKTQLALQLWREKLISGKTFLNDQDYDWDSEQELIDIESDRMLERNKKQARMSAEAQGEGGVIMAKEQVRSQYEAQKLQESYMDRARGEAEEISRKSWIDYLITLPEEAILQVASQGGMGMADLVTVHLRGKTTDETFMKIAQAIKQQMQMVLQQFGIDPIKLGGLPRELAEKFTSGMISPMGLSNALQQMADLQQAEADAQAAQNGMPPGGEGGEQGGGGPPGAQQKPNPNADPNQRAKAFASKLSGVSGHEAEILRNKIKSTDPEAYKIMMQMGDGDSRPQPEQRPPTRGK